MFKATNKQSTGESKFSRRQQRFYDFLKNNPTGVLSTVTQDGEPHGVVIYFDINPSFQISFVTRAGTRKHDNIHHNNHVMLTVFEAKTQTTVQITGVAEEMADSYEINATAGTILGISMKTSKPGLPPVSKLESGPYVGYYIIPQQARMAIYSHPDSDKHGSLFESVESFELEEEHF